jgi:hypothetical protein|eukprot:7388589-Prymnesium_polylepis.1
MHVGAAWPGRRRTVRPKLFGAGPRERQFPMVVPLQVEGGRVDLRNGTLIALNTAPKGHGSSIYLSEAANSGSGSDGVGGDSNEAAVVYTLPAPPGRWLFIQNGFSSQLDAGAQDADFPYACRLGTASV